MILRNPHSVLAAIETRAADVLDVYVPAGASGAWDRVRREAEKQGVRLVSQPAPAQGRGPDRGREDARKGSGEARVKELPGISVEELFAPGDGGYGLWLALDCLQDPRNVGAIFRTAGFFGVRGILLTEERSSALTETVYDTAAGGVERIPFSLETNLRRALEVAKKSDVWVLGTSERAETPVSEIPHDRNWLLVLGNEEKGMRRLTEETCDMVCTIPAAGPVPSLNVSVAAGILIHSLVRTDSGRSGRRAAKTHPS